MECPGEITPDEDDAQKQLITGEGDKHEQAYLDRLRSQGTFIVEINKNGNFTSAAVKTVTAIRSKARSSIKRPYSSIILRVIQIS